MAATTTTFSHKVSDGTSTVTVNFTLHPIRSSNFQVLVQDAQGKLNPYSTPAAARTYLGHVEGMPGALASGLVRANGNILCRISFESGVEWSSTGVGNAQVRGSTNWKPNVATSTVGSGGAGSQVFAAEVGVDATNAHYIAAGSSIDATLEMVEFSVMAANVAYLRDAAILHRIGKVVVRSSSATDPYVADGNDLSALLNRVREQWNNVLIADVGNTHQLALVVKPGAGGGLAWVGVIGTASRYSANGADSNGDFSVIWRHEAGHNWASSHYEGGRQGHIPEGPTIMSGNSLSRFSSAELVKIIAHRVIKTNILQNLGAYSYALPPRANMDQATFPMGVQVTLNVLANDSDSNGQVLSLSSLPPSSALGGTLQRSGSNQQIIYTPPASMASGVDYLSYQIADVAGNTSTAYVTLRPTLDNDLVAHWPLDEGAGNIAYDTTSSQNDGTLTGGATWTTGHTGPGAISLDGTTGQVVAGSLNLNTNSITIAGWVRCSGTQHDWAGLAMCRNSLTSAGLNLALSNELRYHWGQGNNPSYNFTSGLALRDAIWTFVALVVSPTQATIYMREAGMTLKSATANGTFNSINFQAAPFCLGNDQLISNRMFKGDMDDFRVFQRALTDVEITLLAADGGTPSARSTLLQYARVFGVSRSFDFHSTPIIEEEPMLCGTCETHGTQGSSY